MVNECWKRRWSCYLLFWVKMVEVLTWLDGWKKKIAVNFWYTRDTHWLIKSFLLVGVNTVVLSDWVVGETREILKWPRAWQKAMRWCEKISRFRSGMLFEFERQFVCTLHVVSRISSADAPADGYSSTKKAMIKQYIVNVWWTIFPSPQASARPQRGLCGGEISLTFAATFPQSAFCK